ncbi:sentrin-specific protease 2 isoform X1 [Phyllopteryx taeniolatus]|uniref:sentrin-specific protease 2 isoform X1 n=1 Tax=Phyllopteryx taeniolatus TaxID=161469 RepID=UPI002AD210AF|nr:sentrin-specific protease 2 isoform X1 [Phyllopteryx taeniolatus]
MYGWIFDGISSLFEPATGQANNGELTSTLARRRESHGRPVKRNYQSVDAADSVGQSDHVAAKRRRRDVVINFVKKTVARVASLLRFRKPVISSPDEHGRYKDTQSDTLGIDELRMPWLTSPDWRMDKTGIGMIDRATPKPFQGSLLPLTRKFSGTTVSSERRSSLQLLPSRPAVSVGIPHTDQNCCNGFGHNRYSKPSLTVEEAIKQNDKERYRRLLEMVTEKYSKSQPLPFNQTKPQAALLSHGEHTVTRKPFESAPRKMPYSPNPSVVSWRNASVNKSRWGSLPLSKSYTGIPDDSQHVSCAKKPVAELDLSTEVATRLNLVDRVTPAVGPAGAHTLAAHVRHTEDDIPRLTKEMATEVFRALAQSDPNLVLSAAFKLRITQRDLATLQEGGWLNDEVINFYLSLVMEQCSDRAEGARVYSFSTFFYPKLCGSPGGRVGGHAAVKRWTKAVDIFLYDLVLVPLHLGVHWALAVIDLKAKTVKLYDSMGQRHDDICGLLLLYLKEEHRAKKGRELDSAKWTVGCMRPTEIPQQKNCSDCGVFACKYAQYIAKGRPLTFRQWHMPLFRKLMIWELVHQKLL